jgi:hypothetical protein
LVAGQLYRHCYPQHPRHTQVCFPFRAVDRTQNSWLKCFPFACPRCHDVEGATRRICPRPLEISEARREIIVISTITQV